MVYTIRFPFKLSPDRSLSGLEQPVTKASGGLTYSLVKNNDWYAIKVSSVEKVTDAQSCVHRLWTGLVWALVQRGIPFTASTEIKEPQYADDPAKAAMNLGYRDGRLVHGLVEGSGPSIYPSDKKILASTMGDASLVVSTPAVTFLEIVVQGASYPKSDLLPEQERLKTALDLYAAYWYEASANGRFLTLVMALEAMTTPSRKHKIVLDLLEKWGNEVVTMKSTVTAGSDEEEALEAIKREITFRQDSSIRSRVRQLVLNTLYSSGESTAQYAAKRALSAYDVRSELIHKGSVDIDRMGQATVDAREVLEAVLKIQVSNIIAVAS
jgi:hypothetical protein